MIEDFEELVEKYGVDKSLTILGEIARGRGLGLHQATFFLKTGFLIHSDKEDQNHDSV